MTALAGERRERDLTAGVFGDVARESGFPGTGISEQTKQLRVASLAPALNGHQRVVLLGGPVHDDFFDFTPGDP